MEKVTRRAVLEKMVELCGEELAVEEKEVVTKMIETIAKKSSKSEEARERDKAARKEAMDAKIEVLCKILNGSDGMSCKEIAAIGDTIFTGATSQKISSVTRAAISDGIVEKFMDKKTAKYKLAD